MIVARALARGDFKIQSTLSKSVFGTGSKSPSKRHVLLIESQIKGVKKGRDQLQVAVLQRCPFGGSRL